MRSFVAFMACTGFIVWAHSCDRRILGVKSYAGAPLQTEQAASTYHRTYILQLLSANTFGPVPLDTFYVTAHRNRRMN